MHIIDLITGPRYSTISVNSPDLLNPEDRIAETFSFAEKYSNNRDFFRKTVGIAKYLYNEPESGNCRCVKLFIFAQRLSSKL